MMPTVPMRQVHLDFHTSPDIPDVGADWDAGAFVDTLKKAHVNSINLFAKCHHGMNYYPTKIGPVHPALKFDLLGEQIEACHRAGIQCPIYISICWDVSASERHPAWRQVDKNGSLVGRTPLDAGWGGSGWPWLCVNNAYVDELLAQTEELMSLYECDGFFYDILMYHGDGCLCANCLPEMRREGLDPANPDHRRVHNQASARRCMERLSSTIRAKLPDASIFYNSRWGLQFEDEAQYYSKIDIESLPTGGWGYGFYPLWSRYVRNFGLPMIGMTGRFHRSWADWGGLKHPDALRFECGGILATGGAVCVGDQLHPRGRLNEAVYEVIGEALRDVEAVEPYCIGAEAVPQIGVLVLQAEKDRAMVGAQGGAVEGTTWMLMELHHQFDVITDQSAPDFSKYALLVIPDQTDATPNVASRLREFVHRGGLLLLSHEALLDRVAGNFFLADEMGVDYAGPCRSNPDYFQIADASLRTAVTRPGFPYSLYEGPCVRVQPRQGTQILADAYETYFNRTWEHWSSHGFTPPLPDKADYPAVTAHGSVIYIYGPIFSAYQNHGSLAFRALVGGCLTRLLTAPILETDAPSTAEVTLMRQQNRYIVHVVNYHAARRGPSHVEALETPVPLHEVTIRLRSTEVVKSVYLARGGDTLPFTVDGDVVTTCIPRVHIHDMAVFECR